MVVSVPGSPLATRARTVQTTRVSPRRRGALRWNARDVAPRTARRSRAATTRRARCATPRSVSFRSRRQGASMSAVEAVRDEKARTTENGKMTFERLVTTFCARNTRRSRRRRASNILDAKRSRFASKMFVCAHVPSRTSSLRGAQHIALDVRAHQSHDERRGRRAPRARAPAGRARRVAGRQARREHRRRPGRDARGRRALGAVCPHRRHGRYAGIGVCSAAPLTSRVERATTRREHRRLRRRATRLDPPPVTRPRGLYPLPPRVSGAFGRVK